MKKIFFLFIVACLALMTSCSSTDENLRAMIPDDAAGVVVIDVPSVLSKAQMVKGDTITVPQSLVKVIDEADVTLLGDLIRFLPSSGHKLLCVLLTRCLQSGGFNSSCR